MDYKIKKFAKQRLLKLLQLAIQKRCDLTDSHLCKIQDLKKSATQNRGDFGNLRKKDTLLPSWLFPFRKWKNLVAKNKKDLARKKTIW